MKRKIVVVFCLCVALVFTHAVGAVTPRWSNIRSCFISHVYVNGSIGCDVEIAGFSDVTLISNIDIVLKKYIGNDQWQEMYSWEDMYVVGNEFDFYDEAPNMPTGCTYRLYVTAYVYRDGVPEYLDVYHEGFH